MLLRTLVLLLALLAAVNGAPLRLVATVPRPMGIPRALAVSGDGLTAYVANDEGWNLVAIDLRDPRHPRLAGVGSTGAFCNGVAVLGRQVAASDARTGLSLFDPRPGPDPFRTLVRKSRQEMPGVRDLLAVGDTLVVAFAGGVQAGTRVLQDLEDPVAAWTHEGRMVVGGTRGAHWVAGDHSYDGGVTAAGADGVHLVLARGREVEVHRHGRGRVGSFTAPSEVWRVRVQEGRAWLSGPVLAVADLDTGQVLAHRQAVPNAGTYGARVPAFVDARPCAGGMVAALDRFWGLRVLRGDTLEEVGEFDTSGGDYTGLQADGDRLYVGNNWGGVTILSLEETPRVLGGTRRVAGVGSAGFLARGGRLWSQGNEDRVLRAWDVSDPSSPRVLASLAVRGPGDTRRFGASYPAWAGPYLLLPGYARVVEAEDLTPVGEDPAAGFAHDAAAVAGSVGVLTGEDGLVTVDLRDPRRPRRLGTLPGDHGAYYFARGLQITGRVAWLVNRQALEAVDLADPSRPRVLSTLRLEGEPVDVRVEGGRAYVAAYYGGLHVVDVADPENPRLLETFRQPAAPEQTNPPCYQAVEVAGGRVYVAEYHSGIQVLEGPAPGAGSRSP